MSSQPYDSRSGYAKSTAFCKVSKKTHPATPATPASQPNARKRKAVIYNEDVGLVYDEEDEVAAAAAQSVLAEDDEPQLKKARRNKDEEKRLRRFRASAPRTYLERLERVRSQRMFLIDRERKPDEDDTGEVEVFDLAGTTGNIYQVTVSKVPSCTCPDNEKGNQCKHIVYVLVNVLKVREDLAYQLAFLSTELAEIFASAPVAPQSSKSSDLNSSLNTGTGGKRKPIEGDCPVCVMEFEEGERGEEILWCKAACGQNIHKSCFEQWAKSKPGEVKCVYCRTPWEGDEETVKRINKKGKVNSDGYVNVASELGLSGRRDTSTYHQPWVRVRGYGGGGYRGGYDVENGYGSGPDDY